MTKTELKKACIKWLAVCYPRQRSMIIETNKTTLMFINSKGVSIPLEIVPSGNYYEKTDLKEAYDFMFGVVGRSGRDGYFIKNLEQFKAVINYEVGQHINLEQINEIRLFKQHLNIVINDNESDSKSFKIE